MAISSFTAGTRLRASTLNTLVDEINNIGLDLIEVIKSADTNRISTTTLAVDPHLTVAVLASTTYTFDMLLFSNSPTAADIQYSVAFPTGGTCTWGAIRLVTTASPTGDADFGAYATSTSASSAISAAGTAGAQITLLSGTLTTSTTPGNLQLYWSQSVSTATNTTLLARSSLVARRVR